MAANVSALGGTAVLAGVVGADAAAERIRESLAAAGVQSALVTSDSGRPTTIKTRIVAQNQQVVRADRERSDDITAALEDGLVGRLRGALPTCGALVVSDYQKGVVTPRLMRAVVSLARRRGIPVLWTPRSATSPCTAAWPWSRPTSSRPSRPPASASATRTTCWPRARGSCGSCAAARRSSRAASRA